MIYFISSHPYFKKPCKGSLLSFAEYNSYIGVKKEFFTWLIVHHIDVFGIIRCINTSLYSRKQFIKMSIIEPQCYTSMNTGNKSDFVETFRETRTSDDSCRI